MSRSYRKTKIFNCTEVRTNKYAKQFGNRSYRIAVKEAIRNGEEIPHLYEKFNTWDAPSDGKKYDIEADERAMRK